MSQAFELEFASDLELLIRSLFLSQRTVHQRELEVGLAFGIVANRLLQYRFCLGKVFLHVIRLAQVTISGPLIRVRLQRLLQVWNSLGRLLLIEEDGSQFCIRAPVVRIRAKLGCKFLLRLILLAHLQQQVTDGKMHSWQIRGDVLDDFVFSQSLGVLLRVLIGLGQELMCGIRVRSHRE